MEEERQPEQQDRKHEVYDQECPKADGEGQFRVQLLKEAGTRRFVGGVGHTALRYVVVERCKEDCKVDGWA
jgi:hypothetical protein